MRKAVRKQVAKQSNDISVESIMEARFDRLENKLDAFKDEINAWK